MTFPIRTAIAALAISVAGAGIATAQQTKDQQKCIAFLNKGIAKISSKRFKEVASCVKSYANDPTAPDIEACILASTAASDAQAKLLEGEPGKCSVPPTIGPDTASVAGNEAANVPVSLVGGLLGAFATDVLKCSDAPAEDGCACQAAVVKTTAGLWNFYVKSSIKCQKAGLKAAGAEQIVDSAGLLECIVNEAKFDPSAKLLKLADKSQAAIAKGCAASVTDPLPSSFACGGLTGVALAACLDVQVRCDVCVMLNYTHGIGQYDSCETFDDGIDNASCHGI